jgi:hypothetical protein
VPYRVAGEPDQALVPVETMLNGMRGLSDRLAELAERNEALAIEVGTLRERTGGQEATIGRLEQERDHLRAEVEQLRAAQDAAPTRSEPLGEVVGHNEGQDAPVPWWRFWARRG